MSQTIKTALESVDASAHQLRDTAATRMQRTFRDIRVTQSMLRHRNIMSTMKYTAASNEDLQHALGGLDWVDAAQQLAPPAAALDVSELTPEQLQALAVSCSQR